MSLKKLCFFVFLFKEAKRSPTKIWKRGKSCIYSYRGNRKTPGSMNKLIEAFLRYIRYELNLSACTVLSYGNDLRQLQQYFSPDDADGFDAASITVGDLRAWMLHLSGMGDGARTIRRKVQAVRAFYKYLMRRGLVESNPAADIELAKFKMPLPAYLRVEKMDELLDAPTDGNDYNAILGRTIVMTLYETGIRRAELIDLRDADVDTGRGEMKVHGKRNKERIVPFGRELAQAIEAYREMRGKVTGIARPQQLFLRTCGKPLYPTMVYRIVHDSLATVGGAHKLSPHVLRHTFASAMLNNGAEINSVKEIMGHESLAATQVYTHITFSELKSNYKLAHPRALKKEVNYGSKD